MVAALTAWVPNPSTKAEGTRETEHRRPARDPPQLRGHLCSRLGSFEPAHLWWQRQACPGGRHVC